MTRGDNIDIDRGGITNRPIDPDRRIALDKLSPLCPKAETLYTQIRSTIVTMVGIHKATPKTITVYSQATNEGFTVKVCINFTSEQFPVYFRKHHEVKPVTVNEADVKERLAYVMPRLAKKFQTTALHFHASINDIHGGSGSFSRY